MSAWTDHVARWKDCRACPLCDQRFRICLARGDIPCSVLFIGEAPGQVENDVGQPFRGPAGRLLDQTIERALAGFPPDDVTCAFTNLVCCFPAEAKSEGINEPHLSEVKACHQRLVEFVNIARPRLIVCVGRLAEGHVDHDDSVVCADIVHPAAILRMPLAQKQMAIQKCVVTIRCAVEDMLRSGAEFTEWGSRRASLQTKLDLRREYERAFPPSDIDIPF